MLTSFCALLMLLLFATWAYSLENFLLKLLSLLPPPKCWLFHLYPLHLKSVISDAYKIDNTCQYWMKTAQEICSFFTFLVFIKKLIICGSSRSVPVFIVASYGTSSLKLKIKHISQVEFKIIENNSSTFCQLGTSSSWLAQNGGATSTDHNALGVTEHSCNSVASGALDIHEVGVGVLHQAL